jgi:DNA-binding NarL/FixJ family response regulator
VKKKILICDDHPLIIDGLRFVFNNHPDFEIEKGISHYKSLVEEINVWKPDIVLLDINLNGDNGIDEISNIKYRCPAVKIIIFTSYNLPSLVARSIKDGASGYVLKDTDSNNLSMAFYKVLEDKIFIGPGVKFKNKRDYFSENTPDVGSRADEVTLKHILSDREIEIFHLILNNYTEQTMANELNISKHTVHSHRKNIFKKLKLKNNAQIIKYAFEHNLMTGQ